MLYIGCLWYTIYVQLVCDAILWSDVKITESYTKLRQEMHTVMYVQTHWYCCVSVVKAQNRMHRPQNECNSETVGTRI